MLRITIPAKELWDEEKEEFISTKEHTLDLEHSLVSISKWESKWHKPFLSNDTKTNEEILDYIRCMTITQNVDPDVYNNIPIDIQEEIQEYINDKRTATWFNEDQNSKKSGRNSEQITSELIYYWMIAQNIPIKCEKWHLNRLLTLVQVCNIKNAPPKKMGKNSIMSRNASLNAARRKRVNSKG